MFRISLIRQFFEVEISSEDLAALKNQVSWRQPPFFPRRGRLAWYVFANKPRQRSDPFFGYQAAKIKGVGVYNPPGDATGRDAVYKEILNEPRPPTTDPLSTFSSYPHLGFTPEGAFTIAYGDVAPIGGITLNKALREYDVAKHLYIAQVPCIAPLLVFRYDDPALIFRGDEMGVVISGTFDAQPYRLSEAQFGAGLGGTVDPDSKSYYQRLLDVFEIDGDRFAEDTRLRLLCHIAYQVGERIAQFSRSGLYRYSGELPNFEFDFSNVRVILTDLDSCDFLINLDPTLQRLQVMRDLASALYHFVAKFATPRALGSYSIPKLLEHDPISHLLAGYFGSESFQVWRPISHKFWSCFIPHFVLLNNYQEQIVGQWDQERRRTYKMDHHLFFTLVFSELTSYFSQGPEIFPGTGVPEERIDMMSREFLGQRYDYLCYLRQGLPIHRTLEYFDE